MYRHFILWIVFVGFLLGCKKEKGSKIANHPPETSIFLDQIPLQGEDRLNALVTLHWSGEDKDGIVVGFEYSFDNQTWLFTTKTDSTFRLSLDGTADTSDIMFYVRAIDDESLRDPTPASLKIPIRNTAPTVQIDHSYDAADTTYPVILLYWNANDLDGAETLDSIYLKANNGVWLSLPASIQMVTIVPQNPKTSGSQSAYVYLQYNKTPLTTLLQDFVVEGHNQFFVKAKDKGGLFSTEDSSKVYYVYAQRSDLLLIDGQSTSPRAIQTYSPILQSLYGSYDYLDLTLSTSFPKLTLPLERWFLLHTQIFWYAQNTVTQLDYIEKSESIIQNSLNAGKKLLFSLPVTKSLSPTSAIYRFSPIDSLTQQKDAFMMSTGQAYPDALEGMGYPVLKNSGPGLISQISPFYVKASARVLYRAELVAGAGSWTDSTTIAAKLLNNQNKTNCIFFVIPLEKLNGNSNLQQLFQAIQNEFNW